MTISEIDVDELAELLASGASLVDVREHDEWRDARVPGVPLVPLQTVPDNIDVFSVSQPVYIICRSGARSMRVAQYLESQGVEAVNVAGGTNAWIESGRNVESGPAGE